MGHANNVLKNYALSGGERNRDGYPCFRRDWKEEYIQMLMTNTISQTFYTDAESLRDMAMEMHSFAADEDPEFMARALIYARNRGFMRLQPIIGLAVLSIVSIRLFKAAFPEVVRILPDLVEFSLVLESLGRGQGGRAVKRAAAARLANLSEYEALKYSGGGRGYSLRDLLKVYHPKAANETAGMILKYVSGSIKWDELPESALPQIRAFEQLKRLGEYDDAEAISLVREYRLPHNVVTGAVGKMSRELWGALMPEMPLFALLRHLATLERNGLISEREADAGVIERLTNPDAVRRAKILPFRFAQAWREVRTSWLKDALEQSVDLSVDSLPEIEGTTSVLLDISGSMDGQYLMAGSVLALATHRRAGMKGNFILFDTSADLIEIPEGGTIISEAAKIEARGGTDTGVGVRLMRRENLYADNIVIVTDEQQNAGSPFYSELVRYRKEINPLAKAFVVDISPYCTAMVPTTDENTYYCFGWSDQIVSFIAQNIEGYGDIVSRVSGLELSVQG